MILINPKAQSWSIDITLGVVVFMAAFFIFYALINSNPDTKASSLKEKATIIIKQVGSGDSLIRIIDNNEINLTRAGALKNLNYDQLKKELRVEGDFCIYLENEDGNLVLINNSYKGIGAQNIALGSTPCSQK